MNCCGERERLGEIKNEQRWDYINLSDFYSTSCWTPLSYGVLYLFLLISIGVYAVDLFVAANLLFFDRWSGQVKPAIPFNVSRWIFAGCIILSWILLAYRWWRAVRAIKTGVVAASYMDPLAVRIQSLRVGADGRGWRRFLVFAALTKGRKGAEYVALFTYFSFEAWLRIVFAEGPRQAINALTLYSVMQADLIPQGQHAASHGHTPIVQFFINVQILANTNKEQAAILFGMLYALIIWVFSAISLIVAVLFYLLFLWHHVPDSDGSLTHYCRRKIDSRLHKIVMVKVNKALAKEDKFRARQDTKARLNGEGPANSKLQPTLPILDSEESGSIKRQPTVPVLDTGQAIETPILSRRTTLRGDLTSPVPREPTLPDIFGNPHRPRPPSRNTTQSSLHSSTSESSNAPLVGSASEMGYGGYGRGYSRPPPSCLGSKHTFHSQRPRPGQNFTCTSQDTQRLVSSGPRVGSPSRQKTDMSGRMMPASYASSQPPGRKPMPYDLSMIPSGRRPSEPGGLNRRPTQEYEMYPPSPTNGASRPQGNGYIPFDPVAQSTLPRAEPTQMSNHPAGPPPARNFTLPHRPPQADYFGPQPVPVRRSGTAPIQQTAAYDDSIIDAYADTSEYPVPPYRPATAGPAGEHKGPKRYVPPRF